MNYHCTTCGNPVGKDDVFCTKCGVKFDEKIYYLNGEDPEKIEEVSIKETVIGLTKSAGKGIRSIFTHIGITVVLLIALFIWAFSATSEKSLGISNSYLPDYSSNVTIGEVFFDFFEVPEWSNYMDGNQQVVKFQGWCEYDYVRTQATILFHIDDNAEFYVESIYIDGTTFNDVFSIADFLQVFYDSYYQTV